MPHKHTKPLLYNWQTQQIIKYWKSLSERSKAKREFCAWYYTWDFGLGIAEENDTRFNNFYRLLSTKCVDKMK